MRQLGISLFTTQFGYTHLTDLGLDPTKAQLTGQLRALCKQTVRSEDHLVIYFAGHGEVLEATGEHVLLTGDTDPDDIADALPTAELARKLLLGTPVQRLLLFTCYSGLGGNELAAAALAGMDRDWDPHRGGFVVISSALPAEQAAVAAFPSLLTAAMTSLATAGYAPPSLDIPAVVTAMNDDENRPAHQRIGWQPVGLIGQLPISCPTRGTDRRCAQRFISVFGAAARDLRTSAAGDTSYVCDLVIRGLAQTRDKTRRAALLDIIDELMKAGAYGVDDTVERAGR